MINLLVGTQGSGKSYEAVVHHIIAAIERGRKVITNMPLNIEHFRAVYGDEKANLITVIQPTAQNTVPFKTINDFGDKWRMTGDNPIGPLYVIDECHKSFPLGEVNKEVEQWFGENRHELADVLLITQSYGKIWKSLRDAIHIVYRVRKNIALGSSSSYVRKVQDGIRGEIVNQSIRSYEPKYFPFYKSHTKSDSSAKEATANDIKPIWFNWTFLIGIPLVLFGLYRLVANPLPFSSNSKPLIKEIHKVSPVVQVPIVQPANNQEPQQMQFKVKDDDKIAASHPYYKLQMHIGGYIESADKTRYLYNIQLSQNGQLVSTITDKDLTFAGYTVEAKGACLFKIKFNNFYDYVSCDLPQTDVSPTGNYKSRSSSTTSSVSIAKAG